MALAAFVSAHMTMTDPCPRASANCVKPAGTAPTSGIWNTGIIKSPIDPATPDFCKTQMKWSQPAATWTAGQSVTVQFLQNPAAHSGGHAQFSLSYDGGKTFVVVYQVLKYFFFKGPAKGNNNPEVLSYTFTLPKDLPSSDSAVFSWSWVNASGNREFYQNCADVVIKGTGSKSYTGKKMVIANINGYPTIPEMTEDYNIGVDLYNKADSVTVTGSGSSSSSSGNNAPKDNPDNIPSSTAAAPAPTPTQTPAASTSNNNSGGCTHGAMNCASGSTGYEVCVWGTKTPMPCAPGTACKANGAGSILCDFA
ncbi:hypothetical protein LPJ72_004123 [Coemansia sp. Benny D160-2]|nr:hypothetical protein LPJ72_004123 [Coemansia sp. Benny D160-2]